MFKWNRCANNLIFEKVSIASTHCWVFDESLLKMRTLHQRARFHIPVPCLIPFIVILLMLHAVSLRNAAKKLMMARFLLSYKKLDRVACAPVLCINASSSRGIQEPQLSSETTLITLICFRERLSRVTRYLWESSTLVMVGDKTNYIYFFGE